MLYPIHSFLLCFQLTLPTFPVVVKIGHAHSGMGKVRLSWLCLGIEAKKGNFHRVQLWTILPPLLLMNSFQGEDDLASLKPLMLPKQATCLVPWVLCSKCGSWALGRETREKGTPKGGLHLDGKHLDGFGGSGLLWLSMYICMSHFLRLCLAPTLLGQGGKPLWLPGHC